MPRFQIGSDTGPCLQDALKSIGLTDIFDKNKSDLSLMAPNHNLYLTSITHRYNNELYTKPISYFLAIYNKLNNNTTKLPIYKLK